MLNSAILAKEALHLASSQIICLISIRIQNDKDLRHHKLLFWTADFFWQGVYQGSHLPSYSKYAKLS